MGSGNQRYIETAGTHDITMGDDFINVKTSVGAITLVFPNIRDSGAINTNKVWFVNDVDDMAATNNVTIVSASTNPATELNGGASVVLDTNGFAAEIVPSGYYSYMVNSGTGSSGSSSHTVISVTYAEAQTLVSGSQLQVGTQYLITDRADAGIMLVATTTNKFSLEGQGVFFNPDFQGIGDYSGVVGYNTTVGVWYAGGEAGWVNGDIVFWNGLHYVVTDDAAFAGTDPSATPLAYTLLTKSVANGYIEEVDFIFYDFANDTIIWQEDERGNKWNPDGVDSFQRGNDLYKNVYVNNGANIDSINQRGTILSITLFDTVTVVFDNTNEGQITGCTFGGGSIINCNFNLGKTLDLCSIAPIADITFDNTKSYAYKTINSLASNFEADLDMTNGVNYGLITERITIPPNYNYVGEFRLINNTGQTITQINGLPTTHKCRFYVEDGNTQLFNHISIGVAITNNLVSDGAAINTIVGRTNGSDFIEYEKAGNLNRAYLINIII